MLLECLDLKGFLSYYGTKGEDGKVKPVVIDLRKHALWLVVGRNGAGKSALFDAITFSLFKHHRGGEKNFDDLINDAADRAEINLYLAMDGSHYRIQRTIKRTPRGASVWGIVRRWVDSDWNAMPGDEDDKWQAVPGTQNKVEEWVSRHVRMSYETFVSAVVLRQGEADAFFDAKPAQRKDRLLELLDLKFYKKLGDEANTKRTHWHNKRMEYAQTLDKLQVVTDADIDAQCVAKNLAEGALVQAQKRKDQKDDELADAMTAAGLMEQIEGKERQRREDGEILAQEVSIVAAAQRYRELTVTLPSLRNLWDARRGLAAEQAGVRKVKGQIIGLNIRSSLLAPRRAAARRAEKAAEQEQERCAERSAQTEARRREHARRLEQLDGVARLENHISNALKRLQPHQSILERAGIIEKDRNRHEDLREAIPLLRALDTCIKRSGQARGALCRAQGTVAVKQHRLKRASALELRWRRQLEAATRAYDDAVAAVSGCTSDIMLLKDKLGHRGSVAHEQECPICGSSLATAEAQARLAAEQTRWTEELDRLEDKKSGLDQRLASRRQAKIDAESAHSAAFKQRQVARMGLTRARSDLSHTRTSASAARKDAHEAKVRAGAWADEIDHLTELATEADALRAAPEQWHRLVEAREVETSENATMAAHQSELNRLPHWSPEKRSRLRADSVALEREVRERTVEAKNAAEVVVAAKKRHEAGEATWGQTRTDLAVQRERMGELGRRRGQAEADITRRIGELPIGWADNPAAIDIDAMRALERERDDMGTAEAAEVQLNAARSRVAEIDGAIRTLRGQLDLIPADRRRDVAEVEVERDVANAAIQDSMSDRDDARGRLGELVMRRQQYDENKQLRDDAQQEDRRYSHLARAFGRDGLQAQIVRQAQQDIVTYANATLGRLSNGMWQIEVREDEQGTELNILARDLSRPEAPIRAFEYLSGGEKFRVAISVAVAIGQSISGGRTVDTLVIDEGFGSLDEINRDLLVAELRRLSDDVLHGGRVVVVSHEDDVIQEFGSRYHITKDTDGATMVTCEVS